jgi:hypothetical protein
MWSPLMHALLKQALMKILTYSGDFVVVVEISVW